MLGKVTKFQIIISNALKVMDKNLWGSLKTPPGLNRVKSFDVLPLTAMSDHCCLRASIKSNLLVPPSCESELDTVKLNQLSNGFWSDKASMKLFRNILLSFDY